MAPLLEFPPSLTGRQRAVLHELAGAAGIPHRSTGDTVSRVLRLGPEDGDPVQARPRNPLLPDIGCLQCSMQWVGGGTLAEATGLSPSQPSTGSRPHMNHTFDAACVQVRPFCAGSPSCTTGSIALHLIHRHVISPGDALYRGYLSCVRSSPPMVDRSGCSRTSSCAGCCWKPFR